MQWYLNTFILATANMLISLFVVTMTAYVFSRYRFRGKRNTLMSILVLQMFPAFFINDCNLYPAIKGQFDRHIYWVASGLCNRFIALHDVVGKRLF